mgnify:CR=1 FL=1
MKLISKRNIANGQTLILPNNFGFRKKVNIREWYCENSKLITYLNKKRLPSDTDFFISSWSRHYLGFYSELSNKHAANLILFEKTFLPTCLIRTYTFIYFQGKFLPTQLLDYLFLLILAEIFSYKIILSSFMLLFCSFKHFKEASMSKINAV